MSVDSGRGVTSVSVGMRVWVAGADVEVDASVDVGEAGSVAACAVHEESINVVNRVNTNSFLIISNSFAIVPESWVDQFMMYTRLSETANPREFCTGQLHFEQTLSLRSHGATKFFKEAFSVARKVSLHRL